MLKTHWRLINAIERIGDNILVIVAFFLTYQLRDFVLLFASLPDELRVLGPIQDYVLVPAFALPLFNLVLGIVGAYRSMRRSSAFQLFRMTMSAAAVVFLCLAALLFIFKLDLSRSFIGIFCGLSGLLFFAQRCLMLAWLRFFRVRGRNFRNLLIAGKGPQARLLFDEIVKQPELGMRVIGLVDLDEAAPDAGGGSARRVVNASAQSAVAHEHSDTGWIVPVVATAASFEEALKKYAIDEVIFTEIIRHLDQIEGLAAVAAEEGVSVTLAADLFSLELVRSDLSYFGGIPLVHYQSSPADPAALFAKRCIDLAAASALLVALSPLLLLTSAAIKLDSGGPVFFRQRRVGLNGRRFMLLKFRSMVDGAEGMLEPLRRRNEMKGPVFKIKDDPRITRVGRFIRRFSIDELPQLLNVLKGDMSLVGPRPPLPDEVKQYERKQRRRLSMRPGLTCIWQVSGRNEIPDFERWAEMDLQYIDNWSLGRDFVLMLKTIPAVFSGSGAR